MNSCPHDWPCQDCSPLEQTQDIPGRIVAGQYSTNGVFRIDRTPGYECHVYAPELSERYAPHVPNYDLTKRQAE